MLQGCSLTFAHECIYSKFWKFYRWARRPKAKPNSSVIVHFENIPEHGEPSVALAMSVEANVAVLENLTSCEPYTSRRSATSSKRSNPLPQDATSDRVSLDF